MDKTIGFIINGWYSTPGKNFGISSHPEGLLRSIQGYHHGLFRRGWTRGEKGT
jgi:hypothetical protein